MINKLRYPNSLKNISTRIKYNTVLGSIADQKPTSRSSTGYKGVYIKTVKFKNKIYRYYEARIQIDKKEIVLGKFSTLEEAIIAREEAVERYYNPIVEEAKRNGEFEV